MGSGTILREVIAAAELLQRRLRRRRRTCGARPASTSCAATAWPTERWNLLHPTAAAPQELDRACLEGHDGPVIASTDYMRNYADQVREHVQAAGRRYVVLGTDGFGRSDYRVKLRRFFEVDR